MAEATVVVVLAAEALAEAAVLAAVVRQGAGNKKMESKVVSKTSKIPKWLIDHLEVEDLQKVEEHIFNAEKKTSGEIVPIVVKRSSTVGHVPLTIVAVTLAIVGFADAPFWISEFTDSPYWASILIMLVVVFLFARALSPLSFIQRWFTPKNDQKLQVLNRALAEFHDFKIHHTDAATGVLIFVSMMERQAVVLGDRAINEKIDSSDWEKVIDAILSGIRNSSLEAGLSRGIGLCGELLAKHFPIQNNDKNELLNHLVIKD